eukprot:TRINITY_DN16709_c0_g1_i1.p1 TRINITY_DN16709_c0_g1~~TRINITY_DN16709_c0_g1_i1.p1  ORF type:complete len:169 (+),score=34.46 TRINITY_DN16709_c0_g1_i1:237-743(+)
MGDHTESIELLYDPAVITYEELLEYFWKSHNPTTHAWSVQYKSGIWYHEEAEKEVIARSIEKYESSSKRKIQTTVEPADTFYIAEDYHQKWYLRKHDILMKALAECGLEQEDDMINSFAATRLNAIVSGKGSLEQWEKEDLGVPLNAEAMEYVTTMLSSKRRVYSCAG